MPVNTDFLEALASSAPAPGGGGGSAYCGALASSLASMVGNLTVGKKAYAGVEAEVYEKLDQLQDCRQRLLQLIDDDATAFLPVAAVYRMPKDTPEEIQARKEAMAKAIDGACAVPLQIMQVSAEVLDLSEFMAYKGSRIMRSDAGAAAVLANAAVQAAALNVYVNIASMEDAAKAAAYRDRCNRMLRTVGAKANSIYAYVVEEVDPSND